MTVVLQLPEGSAGEPVVFSPSLVVDAGADAFPAPPEGTICGAGEDPIRLATHRRTR
jgi:hypothetical protein